MATKSVSEEVVTRLAAALRTAMPSLKQVLSDFPEPNEALQYPSISISNGAPRFRALPLRCTESGTVNEDTNRVESEYHVGEYDFNLQLDLWAATKKGRNDLYEEFFNAFNSGSLTMGLSLELTDYHAEMCRYDLGGYEFKDNEATSQRKEWRAKVSVMASCAAWLTKSEYAIVATEIHLGVATSDLTRIAADEIISSSAD